MLKELEEPGKERVRHLNHRKEKDPPHDSQPRGRNNMQSNHKNKTHSQVSSMKNRASKKKKKKDALLRLFKATCCYSSMPRTFFNSSSAGGRILGFFMLWTEKNKTQPGGLRQLFPFISGHQNPSGSFENLGCRRCPPGRLHWRTESPKQASLLKAEALAHTTAVSKKLRSRWICLHRAAPCRVSTSRHHPVPWPELLLSHGELCKGAVPGVCLQDIRNPSLVGTAAHQE